jgi:hypothetical protein
MLSAQQKAARCNAGRPPLASAGYGLLENQAPAAKRFGDLPATRSKARHDFHPPARFYHDVLPLRPDGVVEQEFERQFAFGLAA